MEQLLNNVTIYRLWRLRRLIAVSLGLPWLSLGLFLALNEGAGPVARPAVALVIVALWSVLAVVYVLRYPRAPLPSVHFGIATALLLPSLLLGDWLVGLTGGPMQDKHVLGLVGLVVLGIVLWFGVGIVLEFALEWAARRPKRRSFRIKTVTKSPLSPADALARQVLHPGAANALRRCGPLEADGRFAVWVRPADGDTSLFDAPDLTGPWIKTESRPPDYWILTQDQSQPNRLTTLLATPDGATEALVVTVSPTKSGGAIVTTESLSNTCNAAERVVSWLLDVHGDIATAENDIADGRTMHRALCLLPLTSPGMALIKASQAADERDLP